MMEVKFETARLSGKYLREFITQEPVPHIFHVVSLPSARLFTKVASC